MCRKLVYLISLVLVLSATGSVYASLVSHWTLDDGSGNIAKDSAGGITGIVRGGAAWVAGKKGGAMQFDGSNDCIDLGNTLNPTGSFSVAMWANIQNWSSEWLHSMMGSRSDGVGWCLRRFGGWWSQQYPNTYTMPTNVLSFTTRGVGNTGDGVEDSPSMTVPPQNEWVHITCVYDHENNLKYIYFNAQEDARWPTNTGTITAATQKMYIGARSNTANTDPEAYFTGMLDDVRFYDHALTALEVEDAMRGSALGPCYNPSPASTDTDVPKDSVLTWSAGPYAKTHDVYFGTVFDDVNSATQTSPKGVLVSQGQEATSYAPAQPLEYGQIYYWRVDEVNAPEKPGLYKGEIWNFTAELYAYPVTQTTATASSVSNPLTGPINTINGSGLSINDQHATVGSQMWLSKKNVSPVWIQYAFDAPYKLYQMWVWNSNQMTELDFSVGAKDVTIEYSTDGTTWTILPGVPEFAQAPGESNYMHNTTVDFGGVMARYVKLTINTNWSDGTKQAGLSEVRFFSIPVKAYNPTPAPETTDVALDAVLNWRPGREAARHDVYIGTDPNAVANGTAPVKTVSTHSLALGSLALDYNRTYYWKVNEVNDAAIPQTWDGPVWSFTTIGYAVVDDFEKYDDLCNRIFLSWGDQSGFNASPECGGASAAGNGTGSTVGNSEAPYAEQTIVHVSTQSMPLGFDNTRSPYYAETQREWTSPQVWTAGGVNTLRLYLRGDAASFVETSPGTLIMNGTGSDIWDVTDQCRFAYKTLIGNGSIMARVDVVGNTDVWAKAGVMIRESVDSSAPNAGVFVTPVNGISFQNRATLAGTSTNVAQAGLMAPYWVKLTRTGNSFTAQRSADGITWENITTDAAASTVTIDMANEVYIGLAVTSHVSGAVVVCGARFSNVSTTGGASGAWQVAEIGVAQVNGNIPETFYVAVQDSGGKLNVVSHPDPGIISTGAWEEWNIPLSQFTSAGINLNSIKRMILGIGNRSAPTPGNLGKVIIDDIRLTRVDTP